MKISVLALLALASAVQVGAAPALKSKLLRGTGQTVITANRMEEHPCWVNLRWEKEQRTETCWKIHKALTTDG